MSGKKENPLSLGQIEAQGGKDESGSFDALVERVRYAVPKLLELNGEKHDTYILTYPTQREDQVAVQ